MSKLSTESRLAGASRPVEQQLQGEGLVSQLPHKGVSVREVNEKRIRYVRYPDGDWNDAGLQWCTFHDG
ncbi:hypothetical protein GCM10010912_03090 [Paenibacillus albidus]|uniref:Uncharacterized protein n=1 Tax=Paenibacillus albidus TaxID=2041023 RepID=A0A917FB68_9BACL|nr:hypothetical protein [Paenibacillus albidus]GGF61265.1 hypothetical protein GCM10010912_03090 [Paenibacillus albidus]